MDDNLLVILDIVFIQDNEMQLIQKKDLFIKIKN